MPVNILFTILLAQVRNTTKVMEPRPGDAVWQGRQPVAVLAETPGHWKTFLRVGGVWWLVDQGAGGIILANPFVWQSIDVNMTINYIALK